MAARAHAHGIRSARPPSPQELRRRIVERVRARRPEVEDAVLTRIYGISDPTDADPAYLDGLRASVSVALDYALEAIERGEERAPPPPPALLAQARMAARYGVGLDIVLRRYFSGYTLLGEFLTKEAERAVEPAGGLPAELLKGRAALLDRLLAAVSEEYAREAATSRNQSSEQRRTERVMRLLGGESLDVSELDYDFDAHHLGVVAVGPGVVRLVRVLAASLDRRLMMVRPEGQAVWAWLGGGDAPRERELESAIPSSLPSQTALALGEPARGLAGWRLTHRQATAALTIARRRPGLIARYADVALLCSIVRDDLLATSLHQLYLAPLGRERGGEAARETLRAYFAAGRNVSSAAAALGVKRHTVTNRLRTIEEGLGRSLDSCAAELEVALRLEEVPSVLPPAGYR